MSLKGLIITARRLKREIAASRVPPVVVTVVYMDDPPEVVDAKEKAANLQALAEAGLREWPPGATPNSIIVKTFAGEASTGEPPANTSVEDE